MALSRSLNLWVVLLFLGGLCLLSYAGLQYAEQAEAEIACGGADMPKVTAGGEVACGARSAKVQTYNSSSGEIAVRRHGDGGGIKMQRASGDGEWTFWPF